MKPQAVKGTHDILPEDVPAWRRLEQSVRTTLERAGAREIRTPVFEYTETFVKTAGESSDLVVQKEMYTFTDRGERSLTLRPEFTPGLLRAYIQHGMHVLPSPVRLFSTGPVFRAENVQRGRYRQFHQVNLETLGSASPLVDAETISLLYDVLSDLGLSNLTVRLGSVGDPEDRAAYNRYLRDSLEPVAGELSETGRERLRLNPMRLLDTKNPDDRRLIEPLKRPFDFLGEEAAAHFRAVRTVLEDWNIPVELDPAMVRGLDYYRRTAFEVHHAGIGAQSALSGGGRYDGLVESLGGPDTPGIGWAFGVERVLDALAEEGLDRPAAEAPFAFLVPLDSEAVGEVATLARALRRQLPVMHAFVSRNPGRGLRDADRSGAPFAILRGPEERAAGTVQVKDLRSGQQEDIAEDSLETYLLERKTTR